MKIIMMTMVRKNKNEAHPSIDNRPAIALPSGQQFNDLVLRPIATTSGFPAQHGQHCLPHHCSLSRITKIIRLVEEINMYAMRFAALSPQQQAQAARIFQDVLFRTDPYSFDYAVDTITGKLTGQRSHVDQSQAKKLHGKRSPIQVTTSGRLQLTDQAIHALAQLILPSLLSDPVEAGSSMRSDLPLAAPSLRPLRLGDGLA